MGPRGEKHIWPKGCRLSLQISPLGPAGEAAGGRVTGPASGSHGATLLQPAVEERRERCRSGPSPGLAHPGFAANRDQFVPDSAGEDKKRLGLPCPPGWGVAAAP